MTTSKHLKIKGLPNALMPTELQIELRTVQTRPILPNLAVIDLELYTELEIFPTTHP